MHENKDPNKPLSLNYNDLFVYNVAATKELDAKNTVLENKVLILEQQNAIVTENLNTILTVQGIPSIDSQITKITQQQ